MSARRFWIQAFPQRRQASVCWLDGSMQPVDEPTQGHIQAHYGPYRNAKQANDTLVSLFPMAGYTLMPFEG